MASSGVLSGAVIEAESSKGYSPPEVLIVKSGWLNKKPPKKGIARTRKRFFTLKQNGQICYYAAETPDGEPVGLKGVFTLFSDTAVTTEAKKGKSSTSDKVVIVVDTDDRKWHLIADSQEIACEWETAMKEIIKSRKMSVADYRMEVAKRQAAKGGVVTKLADKVANSLKTARAQMRTFGFGGSVTVTGSIMGMSVSMGLEIEVEAEEGEIEVAQNRAELEYSVEDGSAADETEHDDHDGADDGSADDEAAGGHEEGTDPTQSDPPAKESRFKRALANGMRGAMGKVKVLAYTMKKYSLSGTIGVGVDLTMFGTGITIEFEISLSSAISEAEYEEMADAKAKKGKDTGIKDHKTLKKEMQKEEKKARKSAAAAAASP